MKCTLILQLALLSLIPSMTQAAAAGPARAKIAGDELKLENNALAVTWQAGNQGLRMLRIEDKRANRSIETIGEAFAVTLQDGRHIAASDLQIIGRPQIERLPEKRGGQRLVASLRNADGTVQVQWQAVLRDGAAYLRQIVTLRATEKQVPIDTITCFSLTSIRMQRVPSKLATPRPGSDAAWSVTCLWCRISHCRSRLSSELLPRDNGAEPFLNTSSGNGRVPTDRFCTTIPGTTLPGPTAR